MNGLKRTPEQLERRQQICIDLEEIVSERLMNGDADLLQIIIDEYVYKLTEQEVDELEDTMIDLDRLAAIVTSKGEES